MSDKTFNILLGILLIVLGGIMLIAKDYNKKQDNFAGKSASYQYIILSIFLIIGGIIALLK